MSDKPRLKVLFACTMNSIRSPMAATLVRRKYKDAIIADSCGVYEGYLDPFMVQVMEDWGVDMAEHLPKSFEDLDLKKFDLIIVLTSAAKEKAEEILGQEGPPVEFWQTPNPTDQMFGPRDLRVMAYSDCRNLLDRKIAKRFRS
jgi:protein-tyrosine-phosphatase